MRSRSDEKEDVVPLPINSQTQSIDLIAKGLKDFDAGKFKYAQLPMPPPVMAPVIEVIRFPGTVAPGPWRITSRALEVARPLPDFGKLALAWAAKEQAMREWQAVMAMYSMPSSEPAKPQRPRWGQPGRHRRRKARRAARAAQADCRKLQRGLAAGF
jgi:hypothetical protein